MEEDLKKRYLNNLENIPTGLFRYYELCAELGVKYDGADRVVCNLMIDKIEKNKAHLLPNAAKNASHLMEDFYGKHLKFLLENKNLFIEKSGFSEAEYGMICEVAVKTLNALKHNEHPVLVAKRADIYKSIDNCAKIIIKYAYYMSKQGVAPFFDLEAEAKRWGVDLSKV